MSDILSTKNYDLFKFIDANRDYTRGHIENIKRAFEEHGNLTKVQPILVNDKYEIIDGQHRFIVCKELGEPIYYTVVPGLGVSDARAMNTVQKSWMLDDYAKSYATSGDPNYIKYLKLMEDYGFSHSTLLRYIDGVETKGGHLKFRKGELKITDEQGTRERLDKLAEVGTAGAPVGDTYFASAFLRVIAVPGYDQKRMVKKLALHENMMERRATREDYQRLLEDIYNFQMSEANRLRLW